MCSSCSLKFTLHWYLDPFKTLTEWNECQSYEYICDFFAMSFFSRYTTFLPFMTMDDDQANHYKDICSWYGMDHWLNCGGRANGSNYLFPVGTGPVHLGFLAPISQIRCDWDQIVQHAGGCLLKWALRITNAIYTDRFRIETHSTWLHWAY